MNENETEVESIIGYKFNNRELLKRALTHSSSINHSTDNNVGVGDYQRLEFLGDALLDFVVAEELFKRYPNNDEGDLSKMRAALVSKQPLSKVISAAGITRNIYYDHNNQAGLSDKMKSDIFESLLAAIYLDSKDINIAADFILKFLGKALETISNNENVDYKSRLLEYCSSQKLVSRFECDDISGPPHALVFYYSLYINDEFISKANGKTKKLAEQKCAKHACIVYGIVK